VIGYGLDENGNQSSETPPGQPAHVLSYTPVDLVASYRAPHPSMAGSALQLTTYTYTLDRDIKRIAFADGQDITYQYGSDGKLSHRVTSRSDELYVYDTSTGKLNGITGSDGRVLAFAYDGDVTTGMTWSGGNNQTSGAVTLSYDANSWIAGLAVNGANVSSFTYDDDGLALTAGALQISRDPASGDVIGTQLGSQLTTDEAINRFGESTSYVSRFNGTALYSEQVTQRDLLGRISDRTEVVSGTTHTYHYVYDAAGRLTDASLDGGSNVHYSYDDNGNRLSRTGPSGTETGAYDLQDRLKTFGARQYTFSEVGALLTMTDSAASATTHYDYDALGNLRSVSLPDGRHVEYEIDAQDRRIGKRVDGARVYGLLYKDGLVPVVQLGASNAVVATFVYGTRTNVPDYMVKGGETYRFVVDHLNSVRMLVRVSDGGVAQRIDYDEFGVATNDTNPGFQPFGFAGGLYDGDTKLVRFGARDYDAVTGRWTAKDPILFGAGQANLYAYVGNEPINRRDTTGLWTLQLGGQVNFGVTGGGTLGVSLGFDDNGNVALLFTAGYGWENGATASGFVAAANADTLNDITGWGKAAGGGVGPVGVEKLWGDGYEGGSLSFGVGTPVEVHAEFDERTWKLDLCTAN
jgi:RHS repeat-associated protein